MIPVTVRPARPLHRVAPAWRFPERLLRHVRMHLLRNYAGAPAPLIQAIHGPSGEGKTFAVHDLLRHNRIQLHAIACDDLESAEAGEPARRIRDAYERASRAMGKSSAAGPVLAALLIDDCDVGLGDWGELTQCTVNRQLALGELMHLADDPLSAGGRHVPIVLIGNNLHRIYAPLRRPGRATLLRWELSLEEKIVVAAPLFPGLPTGGVAELCESFVDEPIAFFAALAQRCHDADWLRLSTPAMSADLFRKAATGALALPARRPATLDDLLQAGAALRQSRRLLNHLEDDA